MAALDAIRDAIPEPAKDARLNLQAALQPSGTPALTPAQRWGVAVACAAAARNPALRDAVLADARAEVEPAVIEDGLAAATIMGMNNVYYRFRHMIGKPSYSEKPARLRMNRLVKPATTKVDFELFSLAVSAINGCELCVRSHEEVVVAGGLTEDAVHDAVRLAAIIQSTAVALELGEPAAWQAAVAAV
ncbi:MAG: carboxymuconolactone decarboxylase family protein [Anaeromyxobacter sp.]